MAGHKSTKFKLSTHSCVDVHCILMYNNVTVTWSEYRALEANCIGDHYWSHFGSKPSKMQFTRLQTHVNLDAFLSMQKCMIVQTPIIRFAWQKLAFDFGCHILAFNFGWYLSFILWMVQFRIQFLKDFLWLKPQTKNKIFSLLYNWKLHSFYINFIARETPIQESRIHIVTTWVHPNINKSSHSLFASKMKITMK